MKVKLTVIGNNPEASIKDGKPVRTDVVTLISGPEAHFTLRMSEEDAKPFVYGATIEIDVDSSKLVAPPAKAEED